MIGWRHLARPNDAHFAVDIGLDDGLFEKIDRIELSRTSGESEPCA
nr:hypothetical protein [Bradyrhizobium macuxiense]